MLQSPQESRSSPRPWPAGDGNAGLCASVSPLIEQGWCQHLGDAQGDCKAGFRSVGGCCGGCPHVPPALAVPCHQTESCPCASPTDLANAVALSTPIAFRGNLHTRAFPMHPHSSGAPTNSSSTHPHSFPCLSVVGVPHAFGAPFFPGGTWSVQPSYPLGITTDPRTLLLSGNTCLVLGNPQLQGTITGPLGYSDSLRHLTFLGLCSSEIVHFARHHFPP